MYNDKIIDFLMAW